MYKLEFVLDNVQTQKTGFQHFISSLQIISGNMYNDYLHFFIFQRKTGLGGFGFVDNLDIPIKQILLFEQTEILCSIITDI